MTQTCEAVYEDGVFRPVKDLPTSISEGQRVRLVVEMDEPTDILRLAAQVYDGLSDEQVREVEQIALNRRDFFNRTKS